MKRIVNALSLLSLTFALVACNSTVMVPGQPLIELKPTQVNLLPGQQQVFEVTVKGQSNPQLDWSATGGTVVQQNDHQVLYTAGLTPGTFNLKATSKTDPAIQAQAAISVKRKTTLLNAPVLTREISPILNDFCVSPEEDRAVVVDWHGGFRMFDAATLRPSGIQFEATEALHMKCQWLGQDRVMVQDSGLNQYLFDVKTGKLLRTLVPSQNDPTFYVSVNQNQKTFIMSTGDGRTPKADLFDFDGKKLGELKDASWATWSPDGQMLLGVHIQQEAPFEHHLLFHDQHLNVLNEINLNAHQNVLQVYEPVWSTDSKHLLVSLTTDGPEPSASILVFDPSGKLLSQQLFEGSMGEHPIMNAEDSYLYYQKDSLYRYSLQSQQNQLIMRGRHSRYYHGPYDRLVPLKNQNYLQLKMGYLRRLNETFQTTAQNGLHAHDAFQLFDVLPEGKGYLYGNTESLTRMDGQGNIVAAVSANEISSDEFIARVTLAYPEQGFYVHTSGTSYLVNEDMKVVRTFKTDDPTRSLPIRQDSPVVGPRHIQTYQGYYVVSYFRSHSGVFDAVKQTMVADLPGVNMTRVIENKLFGAKESWPHGCELGEIDAGFQFKSLFSATWCQDLQQLYNPSFVTVQKQQDSVTLQVHDLMTGQMQEFPMDPQYDPTGEALGVMGDHVLYTEKGQKKVHLLNMKTGEEWLTDDSSNMLNEVNLTRSPDIFGHQMSDLNNLSQLNIYNLPH